MLLGFLFVKIFGAALSALRSRFFCLSISSCKKELHSGRAAGFGCKTHVRCEINVDSFYDRLKRNFIFNWASRASA